MISIPEQFPGIILGESAGISCMFPEEFATEIITSDNCYNAQKEFCITTNGMKIYFLAQKK